MHIAQCTLHICYTELQSTVYPCFLSSHTHTLSLSELFACIFSISLRWRSFGSFVCISHSQFISLYRSDGDLFPFLPGGDLYDGMKDFRPICRDRESFSSVGNFPHGETGSMLQSINHSEVLGNIGTMIPFPNLLVFWNTGSVVLCWFIVSAKKGYFSSVVSAVPCFLDLIPRFCGSRTSWFLGYNGSVILWFRVSSA